MDEIKPIETRYKGYRFRSRLEARWAVFFDSLGIKWEYEPEGFELADGVRYLPDFYLPSKELNNDWYVEIKPEKESAYKELIKSVKFTKYSHKPIMILGNIPEEEKAKQGILYASIIREDPWKMSYLVENYPLQHVEGENELMCARHLVINSRIGSLASYSDAAFIERFLRRINKDRNIFELYTGEEIGEFEESWVSYYLADTEPDNRYIEKLRSAYERARSARFEFGEEG